MRLKNFNLLIHSYNIFQVANSWSDTDLSRFLHTIDGWFRDIWTNSCYFLTESFYQLDDSLWILLIHSFLWVTPKPKFDVWKNCWPSRPLNFQTENSIFPEHIQWFMLFVILSGLWVDLYHIYQHLLKKSTLSGF